MEHPCLELVVYEVKDAAKAKLARKAARDVLKTYDGFISWAAYEGLEDASCFADVVLWRDLAAAQAAAEKITQDPVCAGLMEQIGAIVSMKHYAEDRTFAA